MDLDAAIDWFGQPGIREAAKRGLLSAAHRGVQDIVGRIVPGLSPMPIDRGIMNAGWRAVAIPDGAAIENQVHHAIFVDQGVKAENVRISKAMIDALAEWVQRKGIAPAAEARGVAWAIAKSMKANGIFQRGSGFKILEKFNDQSREKFIRQEVSRSIKQMWRDAKGLVSKLK